MIEILTVRNYLRKSGMKDGITFAALRTYILADISSEREMSEREARYLTLNKLARLARMKLHESRKTASRF
jgi:hypothetical protein